MLADEGSEVGEGEAAEPRAGGRRRGGRRVRGRRLLLWMLLVGGMRRGIAPRLAVRVRCGCSSAPLPSALSRSRRRASSAPQSPGSILSAQPRMPLPGTTSAAGSMSAAGSCTRRGASSAPMARRAVCLSPILCLALVDEVSTVCPAPPPPPAPCRPPGAARGRAPRRRSTRSASAAKAWRRPRRLARGRLSGTLLLLPRRRSLRRFDVVVVLSRGAKAKSRTIPCRCWPSPPPVLPSPRFPPPRQRRPPLR